MSNEIKIIATDKAPAAVGPYSQATSMNGVVYVSGQLGMDPATGEFKGGFAEQARQALENLGAVLKAAGSDFDKVLAVDVFLTDMGKFVEFNGIYSEFFTEHKPARAAVEVKGLPKGGLVELKCIASVGA